MRRPARYLSIALSLGVIVALAWPRAEAPVRREQPKPVAAPTQMAPLPKTHFTLVHLPPPPAPKAAPEPALSKRPVRPLKPTVSAKPPARKATVIPLKPTAPEPRKPTSRRALKPHAPSQSAAQPAAPAPEPNTVTTDAATVTEGRALLRLLEHGTGPAIEIAWPNSRAAQQRLFDRFVRCYGLRVAVLAGAERLYVAEGAAGSPWSLNLDAYSGFMRQHGASAAAAEAAELRRIRARHGLSRDSAAVRIFPRHVDALMLGGLQQAVGAGYTKRAAIRARYALRDGRVLVEDVRADGRSVPGRIDLTPAAHRSCRGGRRI